MTSPNPVQKTDPQVLIVGAGPTGLALALWLARFGVRIRIIDKTQDVAAISRALGVHARTLEFYRQLGFAEQAVAGGVIVPSVNLWTRGRKVASVPFANVGEGLTPFPFVLDFAQDQHERLLIEQLSARGVAVERETELVGLDQNADRASATLRTANGTNERLQCSFIAGCDGTHSTVRNALNIEFGGGTYEHLFYVADATARGPAVDNGIHVDLDESDLLAIFDMKGEGHVRLIGTIRADGAARSNQHELSFDDVARRPIEHLRLQIDRVNWFSSYRVHHRVASRFRVGRAFLLGDAAHVHSPVGAQGMNTGIGDAVNLAWKLAAVLEGRAKATLLDTYETERIAFARRLVATTDRAFEIATKRGRLAAIVRTRLFPLVVSIVFRSKAVRRYLFRTVSQIMINYRHSPLSAGGAGGVHGGDRLPWVRPEREGEADNFSPLASLRWQVHVYGDAPADVREACTHLDVELHQFPWRQGTSESGIARGALYLVRPDGYVALADPDCSAERLREAVGFADAHSSRS
jgi:2-polyprenyl-6-methoxyphenol hydroxylase-like FAD-dependent oxidoreductase